MPLAWCAAESVVELSAPPAGMHDAAGLVSSPPAGILMVVGEDTNNGRGPGSRKDNDRDRLIVILLSHPDHLKITPL